MDTDVRAILPSIHVRVARARSSARLGPLGVAGSARYLVEHIPGAKLEEFPERDSWLWIDDQAPDLNAVDSFLSQFRHEESELVRIIATVLFTDIAGSTEKATELNAHAWRELVERHHAGYER